MSRSAGAGSRVVLCADEYGLSEGVSWGILDLVGMGRVSAVSALATAPAFAQTARELADLKLAAEPVGIGLHLRLARGFAPTDRRAVEIARQIALFCDATGVAPDFVSSHGDAHVLPHIRAALFLALERTGLAGEVWLRDPSERLAAILRRGRGRARALAAKAMALGFARQARGRGLAVNDGFSGFSKYERDYPVEREFQRFLQYLGPRPVVACRPGYVDDALERIGGVVESRSRELMYLSSTRFTDLLEALRITLVASPVAEAGLALVQVNPPPGLLPR